MKLVRTLWDITVDDKGGTILVPNLSVAMVLKAEVVGVEKIITSGDLSEVESGRIKINLPIESVNKDELDKLIESCKK